LSIRTILSRSPKSGTTYSDSVDVGASVTTEVVVVGGIVVVLVVGGIVVVLVVGGIVVVVVVGQRLMSPQHSPAGTGALDPSLHTLGTQAPMP